MTQNTNRRRPNTEQIKAAEKQIKEYSRNVKFTVTEYSFEFIVQKLKDARYYVPDYQRNLIWKPKPKSKFIESVLIGLPIPFVFFWQDSDGRMEIVDGSQRLRTIRDFMDNKIVLQGLELLPDANGLRFRDLPCSRQLIFSETSIRVIILDNSTDAITRTEMFTRINTGGTAANEAEVRRGSLPGPFMDLIIKLANSQEFVALTPISKHLVDKREREEMVTRFFAYLEGFASGSDNGEDDMLGYKEEPRKFYFSFVQKMNAKITEEIQKSQNSETSDSMRTEFFQMLDFVRRVSPYGFTKSRNGNQVPRVRFEAIAVGLALALRFNPNLLNQTPEITPLLESESFKTATKSDAANVKRKLLGRIGLVKNWVVNQ